MNHFDPTILTDATLRLLLACPFQRALWERAVGDHLHLRIGNDPPILDRAAGLRALERFFGRVRAFGVSYWQVWRLREALFAETDCGFADAAGRTDVVPCAITARIAGGALIDLRFHLDPSPIP